MTTESETEHAQQAWEEFLPVRSAFLALRALSFLIANLGILLWWMGLLGAGLIALRVVIDSNHLSYESYVPLVSSAAMICAVVAYTSAVARRASGVSGVGIPFGVAEIVASASLTAAYGWRQAALAFALEHLGQPLPTVAVVGATWIVAALTMWAGVKLLLLFPAVVQWGHVDVRRAWRLSAQKFWYLFFAFAFVLAAEQLVARILFMPIVLFMQATSMNVPWEVHRDPSQVAFVAVLERISGLTMAAGLGAVAGLAFKEFAPAPSPPESQSSNA